MFKKISARPYLLALGAGLGTVLAFPPISITSAVFFCPLLLLVALDHARSSRQAFVIGLLASLAIMLGGFYWVVYVIHVFGHLPWLVATLLYMLFSSLGALNFSLFTLLVYRLHLRFPHLRTLALWYALGIPAVFVLLEALVPKLFPWEVGHAFFQTLWLNQIVELTGTPFLSFLVFSWGGVAAAAALGVADRVQIRRTLAVPIALSLLAVGFSAWRWWVAPPEAGATKHVGLVQANIGSLEKLRARQGSMNRVQYTIEQYLRLSQKALQSNPKPELLLWPETAMPFGLQADFGWATPVRKAVREWQTALVSGGYAPGSSPPYNDYNAAFLLEPHANGEINTQIYHKNILLAFGEYFPGGEWFPQIYRLAPQVSNFRRGTEQKVFTLADGTRLGVTICYEAIVPRFFRRVANQGVHAVVNLTNDSWFGPTSEPYQHAALASFRAIENRTPLLRVTNTGISFVVDAMGRRSHHTPVYDEGVLVIPVILPPEPVQTFYLAWGDWFLWVLAAVIMFFLLKARREPLPA